MYAWKFHRRDKFVIQSVTGGYGNIWSAWTNFVSSWRRAPIRNLFRHSIYSRIPPVTDCITNNIALCTFNIMSIAFTHKWKFTENATHPVIYMRCFFTLMTKTLPRPYYFTKSVFEVIKLDEPLHFLLKCLTKSVDWTVLYICVTGINFTSVSTIYLLYFGSDGMVFVLI